jgi:hypothetical protein
VLAQVLTCFLLLQGYKRLLLGHVPYLQLAATPALRAPYFTTRAFSLGETFVSPNFGHTPTVGWVVKLAPVATAFSRMYLMICRRRRERASWQ